MKIKTFDEYKASKSLNEATITQWAKRSALAGAVAAGTFASIVTFIGPALVLPMAIWGGIAGGLGGLVHGSLFAGGKARQHFKELKQVMKRIDKYMRIPAEKIRNDELRQLTIDLNRAIYLSEALLFTTDYDADIKTSRGALRSDIRQNKNIALNCLI